MNKFLLFIIALAVILGLVLFLSRKADQGEPLPQAGISSPTPSPLDEIVPLSEVVVEMIKGGFSPKEVIIAQGQTVKFVNNDTSNRWPASGVHPTHALYPEFDPKEPIQPGASWSFKFDRLGEWRYHDHLSPSLTGVIKVE